MLMTFCCSFSAYFFSWRNLTCRCFTLSLVCVFLRTCECIGGYLCVAFLLFSSLSFFFFISFFFFVHTLFSWIFDSCPPFSPPSTVKKLIPSCGWSALLSPFVLYNSSPDLTPPTGVMMITTPFSCLVNGPRPAFPPFSMLLFTS